LVGNDILTEKHVELSYEAVCIVEFLGQKLIATSKKMIFETKISYPSKVDILRQTNKNGYKTHLYIIRTSSPLINVERVNLRVRKGGHYVEKEHNEKRYFNSLELLRDPVSNTYRSFILDNSGTDLQLIFEVVVGTKVSLKTDKPPTG
jgi:predicted ABC-type ATPase